MEGFGVKLEQFCKAGGSLPSCGNGSSPHLVHFCARSEMQKWLSMGYVDFAELFRGYGEATIRVREAGCTASEGFDKYAVTYDRCWHLVKKRDQCDCAWLLVYSLRPKVIHCGTPCTKMCKIGSRTLESAEAQNEFTWKVAMHQHAEGLGPACYIHRKSMYVVLGLRRVLNPVGHSTCLTDVNYK